MGTAVSDPLVGLLFGNRYRLSRHLASGGMGSVYLARDERLDRTVAVKVMHGALSRDTVGATRFISEARAVARLSHPNIVAVHDQGEDDGHLWLVMEYIAGQTLRELLSERGRLTPHEAIAVLEPMLAGLAAAHRAGTIHRDVKPENVLLADHGGVKVVDFGLARALGGATTVTQVDGTLLGSISYVAPEQLAGRPAGPQSDVFAVGVIAFEMLTGRLPFVRDNLSALLHAQAHEAVPRVSELVPDVPAPLDDLVASATSHRPDLRPADAVELLGVMRAMSQVTLRPHEQGTVPIALPGPSAHPAPPAAHPTMRVRTSPPAALRSPVSTGPPPASHNRRRRRVVVTALLVLLVLLGLVGGLGYWFGPGRFTTVPTLPATSAAAQRSATAHHFRTDVRLQASDQRAAGQVLSSTPKRGSWVRRGSVIRLLVSSGPALHAVPRVTGLTQDAATRKLLDAKLSVGAITRGYSEDVPSGAVISSDPTEGEQRQTNAAVALVVSRGFKPSPVPDLVGRTLDEARSALTDAQLALGATDEVFDLKVPAGAVIRQSVKAATGVPRNSAVDIVLSKGPPPVEVPQVVDLHRATAIAKLRAAGFVVKVHGSRVLDRVFNQSPDGGKLAPKGSTITIYTV